MKKIFFALILIIFSIGMISAVPEGATCGIYSDGSPFCDAGLTCAFFQCVPTQSPPNGDHCLEYHGEEWCCYDSSATAYIIDDVFICLLGNLNPNEWCCVGGGCDSYDDYRRTTYIASSDH